MDKPIKLQKIDKTIEFKKYDTILLTTRESFMNCLNDLKELNWRWVDGSIIDPFDDFFFNIYGRHTMLMAETPVTFSVHDVRELVNKEDLTYRYINKEEMK